MRDFWLRFGCFLIGYNYNILRGCSESSIRRVLRYTSAILIICLLWAFIGYAFANRYLKLEWYFSMFSSIISVIIIIQIERQVILSPKSNKVVFFVRGAIAIIMAIIGSMIIDQRIFKEDIEQQKIIMLDEKVRKVFPGRAEELKRQISEIDSTIIAKENDRKILTDDISRNPSITVYSQQITQVNQAVDSLNTKTEIKTSSQISNPKIALLAPLDIQIASLRKDKIRKDSLLLVLRPAVEKEFLENVGFLDELNLMFSIFKESIIAIGAWSLWFLLLLGIELFILINKSSDKEEIDYEAMLEQQMKLHFKRIELLEKQ